MKEKPVSLFSKKNLHILGLNSGTSADGIDLALIEFKPHGRTFKIDFIAGDVMPYTKKIKTALEHAIQDRQVDIEELTRLDLSYGLYLGKAARTFLEKTNQKAELIASHGQTIGHFPEKKSRLGYRIGAGLQIGDGNAIAAASGLPVVSDFRRADMAAGGEGAPLTPFINQALFGLRSQSRIIVNIGGIANFSYHSPGHDYDAISGGDCGPGNTLSDLACRLLFHRQFDKDGRLAYRGQVREDIVGLIIQANSRKQVSTGREQFDHHLMARLVHRMRSVRADKYDLMASIQDATARLIHRRLKKYLKDKRLEGVYITGGGRRNLFMIERLRRYCRDVDIWPIEALGYDGDFMEAVSFAILGGCFIIGRPSSLSQVTGGRIGTIAGKLARPGDK